MLILLILLLIYTCMYIYICVYMYVYIYIYIVSATIITLCYIRSCVDSACHAPEARKHIRNIIPDGGMMRLETLIELKFRNSSFSSLSSYRNWTNSSLSSDSRQQLSQSTVPSPSYDLQVMPIPLGRGCCGVLPGRIYIPSDSIDIIDAVINVIGSSTNNITGREHQPADGQAWRLDLPQRGVQGRAVRKESGRANCPLPHPPCHRPRERTESTKP